MSLYNIVNPASIVPGQPEDVSQVLANFQAIQAVLNGGIDDVNIRSTAAISPSKFAGYPSDATKKLQGDGTWTRIPPSRTILASGSGTYTTPAGVKAILVEIWGGGGGAGGSASAAGGTGAGSGGGGGGYVSKLYLAPVATYTYAVAAGVSGGAAGNNAGASGNPTTFDVMQANGGVGGVGSAANTAFPVGMTSTPAAGGNASGGDININGGAATAGLVVALGGPFPGLGGQSPRGGGTSRPLGGSNPGLAGNVPGGGGCGGTVQNGGAAQPGGSGAAGLIVVTEFY